MGMEQKVEFGPARCPAWAAVSELLARCYFPVQLRMIDGQLAFPDETPPEAWRELRVGAPGGMITIRRGSEGVELVTWGNADATLRQSWNALTWAFVASSQGSVLSGAGKLSAEEYRQRESMPPEI
jgi:hypothetical protein